MSLLYEAEVKEMEPTRLVEDLPAAPTPFVCELVEGVQREQAGIDDLIASVSVDWEIDRMPAVDRNVLRLAVYELAHRPEIPVAAVISEAVELAKAYSTEESGRFVNGVLSTVAARVRPAPG